MGVARLGVAARSVALRAHTPKRTRHGATLPPPCRHRRRRPQRRRPSRRRLAQPAPTRGAQPDRQQDNGDSQEALAGIGA